MRPAAPGSRTDDATCLSFGAVCAMNPNSSTAERRTLHAPSLNASDQAWGEYLFFRDNPKGLHHERWRHSFGCGQWFNVARNTITHEVLSVYALTETAP